MSDDSRSKEGIRPALFIIALLLLYLKIVKKKLKEDFA